MTIEEFETLLLAHGANPRHWPAGRRAAAEALLAESEVARALFDEAKRLDAAIAARPRPLPAARSPRAFSPDWTLRRRSESSGSAVSSPGPARPPRRR